MFPCICIFPHLSVASVGVAFGASAPLLAVSSKRAFGADFVTVWAEVSGGTLAVARQPATSATGTDPMGKGNEGGGHHLKGNGAPS